ncbi:unnamed protein product [Notodromas monacha]|uniref:Uncharacterized protein n=1 Tax=Notodromas monacha TaxID=399045 RepID=A0A7R9BFK9_9CRUS|nr:unnamed protein product [Notodromas monacha]CAG0913208.1 unnamed protein product [Notodromas monacha]
MQFSNALSGNLALRVGNTVQLSMLQVAGVSTGAWRRPGLGSRWASNCATPDITDSYFPQNTLFRAARKRSTAWPPFCATSPPPRRSDAPVWTPPKVGVMLSSAAAVCSCCPRCRAIEAETFLQTETDCPPALRPHPYKMNGTSQLEETPKSGRILHTQQDAARMWKIVPLNDELEVTWALVISAPTGTTATKGGTTAGARRNAHWEGWPDSGMRKAHLSSHSQRSDRVQRNVPALAVRDEPASGDRQVRASKSELCLPVNTKEFRG